MSKTTSQKAWLVGDIGRAQLSATLSRTTIHSINVKLPDGSIECRRFRLEFSSHIALLKLAQKAFNNKSRVAKECAGAIVVTALPPLTSGNDQ